MTERLRVHVQWDKDRVSASNYERGRWRVRCWHPSRPGEPLWTRWFDFLRDKDTAVTFAVAECRSMVSEGKLVELYIHNQNGEIEDRRTYPRSSDPERIKG